MLKRRKSHVGWYRGQLPPFCRSRFLVVLVACIMAAFVSLGLMDAAKEVIKGKGKRGRKRKSAALEADEPETEPEPEVARATEEVIKGRGKRGRKRKSDLLEAGEPELEVAQMIDALVP
jgi:hypothetical protein